MSKNYEAGITNWDRIYGNKRVPPTGGVSTTNLFAIGSLSPGNEEWWDSSILTSYNSQVNPADGRDEDSFDDVSVNLDLNLSYISNGVYRSSISSARDLAAYPTITMSTLSVNLIGYEEGKKLTYEAVLTVSRQVYYALHMDIEITYDTDKTILYEAVEFRSSNASSDMKAIFVLDNVVTDHVIDISLTYPNHPIHNPISYHQTHAINIYIKSGHITDKGDCLYPAMGGALPTEWDVFIEYGNPSGIFTKTLTSLDGLTSPTITSDSLTSSGGYIKFNLNALPNISKAYRNLLVKLTLSLYSGDVVTSVLIYRQDFINNLYSNLIPSVRIKNTTADEYVIPSLLLNDLGKTYFRKRWRTSSSVGGAWSSWQGGVEVGDIMHEYASVGLIGIPKDYHVQYELLVNIPLGDDGVMDNGVKNSTFDMSNYTALSGTLIGGQSVSASSVSFSLDFENEVALVYISGYSAPSLGVKLYYYFNDDIHNTLTYSDYGGNTSLYMWVDVPERYLSPDGVDMTLLITTANDEVTPGEVYRGTKHADPMAAPTGLSGDYTDDNLYMTWGAVDGADDYEVKWGPNTGSYTVSATTMYTNYSEVWPYISSDAYFVVRAVKDTYIYGPWSAEKHIAHEVTPPPAIPKPTGFTVIQIQSGNDWLYATWDAVPGYFVDMYARIDANPTWYDKTPTPAPFSNLPPDRYNNMQVGHTAYCRIRFTDGTTDGPWSDIDSEIMEEQPDVSTRMQTAMALTKNNVPDIDIHYSEVTAEMVEAEFIKLHDEFSEYFEDGTFVLIGSVVGYMVGVYPDLSSKDVDIHVPLAIQSEMSPYYDRYYTGDITTLGYKNSVMFDTTVVTFPPDADIEQDTLFGKIVYRPTAAEFLRISLRYFERVYEEAIVFPTSSIEYVSSKDYLKRKVNKLTLIAAAVQHPRTYNIRIDAIIAKTENM